MILAAKIANGATTVIIALLRATPVVSNAALIPPAAASNPAFIPPAVASNAALIPPAAASNVDLIPAPAASNAVLIPAPAVSNVVLIPAPAVASFVPAAASFVPAVANVALIPDPAAVSFVPAAANDALIPDPAVANVALIPDPAVSNADLIPVPAATSDVLAAAPAVVSPVPILVINGPMPPSHPDIVAANLVPANTEPMAERMAPIIAGRAATTPDTIAGASATKATVKDSLGNSVTMKPMILTIPSTRAPKIVFIAALPPAPSKPSMKPVNRFSTLSGLLMSSIICANELRIVPITSPMTFPSSTAAVDSRNVVTMLEIISPKFLKLAFSKFAAFVPNSVSVIIPKLANKLFIVAKAALRPVVFPKSFPSDSNPTRYCSKLLCNFIVNSRTRPKASPRSSKPVNILAAA